MWAALTKVLQGITGGAAGGLLAGAGLGLASGLIVLTVINYYINKIVQSAGALGDMAALLHIGGMDTAISIVIGAVVVRATLSATKLSLTRGK